MDKQTIIVFGLPAAGKTFVSEVLQKNFGYHFHDGDLELPQQMRDALQAEATVTDDMRDEFFQRLINRIKKLHEQYDKLVIAQTFIKEKYREELQRAIQNARFILVQANTEVRENRLRERKEFPLDIEYARAMCRKFDTPTIPHDTIMNNINGEEEIKKQLETILKKK